MLQGKLGYLASHNDNFTKQLFAWEAKSKRAAKQDWIIRRDLDGNLKVLLLEVPQIHLSLHLLLCWWWAQALSL